MENRDHLLNNWLVHLSSDGRQWLERYSAEDRGHAIEQAQDANPGASILAAYRPAQGAICEGDAVAIKPEFADPGDETLQWVALCDEVYGRIDIQPTNSTLRFPPVYTVATDYVTKLMPEAAGVPA